MSFYWEIIVASIKMYFREPQALFWTFFFPVLIMLIFGFINFGAPPEPLKLGFADQANNGASAGFERALRSLSEGDNPLWEVVPYDSETEALEAINQNAALDALVVVPREFGNSSSTVSLELIVNREDLVSSQIAEVGVNDVLDQFFLTFANVPQEFTRSSYFQLSVSSAASESDSEDENEAFSFTDLLVPAVAAMAIMQTSVFGSVFTLIRFKAQGILRRLEVTPAGPLPLLVGQSASRIFIIVAQTYVLFILGILLFDITIAPNGGILSWVSLGLVALLGGFMFLGLGLVLSGRFNSENTAAPVANIVTLPMLFLAGVFFPRGFLPEWLQTISDYLPLTFLVEAMQIISTTGGTVVDAWQQIAGLAVWTLVVFTAGVRLFRWN